MTTLENTIGNTPLIKLQRLTPANGSEVWLKLEHLQTGGSFKARGMMNRLLSHPLPSSGVVVASGGNAGIATAAAARALGARCEVFLPGVTPPAREEAGAGGAGGRREATARAADGGYAPAGRVVRSSATSASIWVDSVGEGSVAITAVWPPGWAGRSPWRTCSTANCSAPAAAAKTAITCPAASASLAKPMPKPCCAKSKKS